MTAKWAFYLFSIYGLLIFNRDFSELSSHIRAEEIANANERQRRIIQLVSEPE